MKVVGRTTKRRPGFSGELNGFLKLIGAFRRNGVFVPKGIYRFKTVEEAEQWRLTMLRGKRPGPRP